MNEQGGWLTGLMQSPEPLALMRPDGSQLLTNPALQRELPGMPLDAELLAPLVAEPPAKSIRLNRFDHRGQDARLMRVDLGDWLLLVLRQDADAPGVERLRQQLVEAEKSSVTDPLTGIWNRQQFQVMLEREHARALRLRQPISLLIIDIDHFKRINDERGHDVGDRILQQLATCLDRELRAIDSLFRWGGEEFVVLAPNTGPGGVGTVGERLRRAVAQHRFESDAPLELTVSIGAATLEHDETNSDWFKRADQALYAAKQAGRNRVRVAPPELPWPDHGLEENPLMMPWLPRYESGHPMIDAQHKRLFELANELITVSIDPEIDDAETTRRLDALIDHSRIHFRDEEALLERIGYADLRKHRRSHQALLEKAEMLRQRVASGVGAHGELLDFLVNRLVRQHLMKVDMDFFPCLAGVD
ncbi:MAG: diguanylate cyclase [Wenzhouxiangellaceae bacterium]|nr:diguanylate cyclase [Wenzhouxiangellaceae bacterium]